MEYGNIFQLGEQLDQREYVDQKKKGEVGGMDGLGEHCSCKARPDTGKNCKYKMYYKVENKIVTPKM